MIYGYARVSTNGQAKDGNSLEYQTRALKVYGAKKIYEESFTGTKKNRPKLNELLDIIQEGDTIVVTKLDRIARSVKDGLEIIDEIIAKGCELNIINMGRFDDSASGKLMRTIFLAFSEFEREMIVQRTQEGKEIAKSDPNYKEGRPKIDAEKIAQIQKGVHWKEIGVSKATWYNYRKEM